MSALNHIAIIDGSQVNSAKHSFYLPSVSFLRDSDFHLVEKNGNSSQFDMYNFYSDDMSQAYLSALDENLTTDIVFLEFVKAKYHDIYTPFIVLTECLNIKSSKFILFRYSYLNQPDVDKLYLGDDIFIYNDRYKHELNVDLCIEQLKDEYPFDIFNNKEWLVGWMIIKGYTLIQISLQTKIPLCYVEKISKKLISETQTYKKELFIKTSNILAWDRFIPGVLLDRLIRKNGTVYKTSPR